MLARAAVEAAVILVGVMIALAADRWVQGLDERAQESDIVGRLAEDLQSDSAIIASRLADARSKQAFAIRLLQDDPVAPAGEPAAFLAAFETVSWSPVLESSRATWDDLIATGRSSLISEQAARRALSGYYEWIERVTGLDAGWNQVLLTFQDRAKGAVPAEVRLSALQADPVTGGIARFGALPETFEPANVTQADVDRLRRRLAVDEELRSELTQVVVVYQGKIQVYPRLLDELAEVLALLRSAL
jgi:hypothetical protein